MERRSRLREKASRNIALRTNNDVPYDPPLNAEAVSSIPSKILPLSPVACQCPRSQTLCDR
jgi:hypothetical protein